MKKVCERCGKIETIYSWGSKCYSCMKIEELEKTQKLIMEEEDVDTGSSDYVICPYCGNATETCYGYEDFPELYEEGEHELECDECGKTFVLESSCSWWYETSKKEGW